MPGYAIKAKQTGKWWGLTLLYVFCILQMAVGASEPVLYESIGDWGAVTGLPPESDPPAPDWQYVESVWVGHLPSDEQVLTVGNWVLPIADAREPEPPPATLSSSLNPFKGCILRTLSIRFNVMVDGFAWGPEIYKEADKYVFASFTHSLKPSVRWLPVFELVDAGTGTVWPLKPTSMARDGGLLARKQRTLRFYGGQVDQEDLDWAILSSRGEREGEWIVQGRIMVMKSNARHIRLRMGLKGITGEGVECVQAPMQAFPGVVYQANDQAAGILPDLAEPRRMRTCLMADGTAGLELDMAVTQETDNFPRIATFSLLMKSWNSDDLETAYGELEGSMAYMGGGIAVPSAILENGLSSALEVSATDGHWPFSGTYRDGQDAVNYLWLLLTDIFPQDEWRLDTFSCMARDAAGNPYLRQTADTTYALVNPDPDLEVPLEMGVNRGRHILALTRRDDVQAVLFRAYTGGETLDYRRRALRMCDYPAVWDEAAPAGPGVDIRHAETELIAGIACDMRNRGIALLVSDAGELAPFTTYHADALVCESSEPDEMKRQRILAGARPVLWAVENPSQDAEDLAARLQFIRIRP